VEDLSPTQDNNNEDTERIIIPTPSEPAQVYESPEHVSSAEKYGFPETETPIEETGRIDLERYTVDEREKQNSAEARTKEDFSQEETYDENEPPNYSEEEQREYYEGRLGRPTSPTTHHVQLHKLPEPYEGESENTYYEEERDNSAQHTDIPRPPKSEERESAEINRAEYHEKSDEYDSEEGNEGYSKVSEEAELYYEPEVVEELDPEGLAPHLQEVEEGEPVVSQEKISSEEEEQHGGSDDTRYESRDIENVEHEEGIHREESDEYDRRNEHTENRHEGRFGNQNGESWDTRYEESETEDRYRKNENIFDRNEIRNSHQENEWDRENRYEENDRDHENRYEENDRDHENRYEENDRDHENRYEENDRDHENRYDENERDHRYEENERDHRYEESERDHENRYDENERDHRYEESERDHRYEENERDHENRYDENERDHENRYEENERDHENRYDENERDHRYEESERDHGNRYDENERDHEKDVSNRYEENTHPVVEPTHEYNENENRYYEEHDSENKHTSENSYKENKPSENEQRSQYEPESHGSRYNEHENYATENNKHEPEETKPSSLEEFNVYGTDDPYTSTSHEDTNRYESEENTRYETDPIDTRSEEISPGPKQEPTDQSPTAGHEEKYESSEEANTHTIQHSIEKTNYETEDRRNELDSSLESETNYEHGYPYRGTKLDEHSSPENVNGTENTRYNVDRELPEPDNTRYEIHSGDTQVTDRVEESIDRSSEEIVEPKIESPQLPTTYFSEENEIVSQEYNPPYSEEDEEVFIPVENRPFLSEEHDLEYGRTFDPLDRDFHYIVSENEILEESQEEPSTRIECFAGYQLSHDGTQCLGKVRNFFIQSVSECNKFFFCRHFYVPGCHACVAD